jgi:hypothetical protein
MECQVELLQPFCHELLALLDNRLIPMQDDEVG